MSEWEARKNVSEALKSPTLLAMKRGLRRPIPVKSLSSSQSGSYSVSSKATSRRSKSIVSTPEDQRLFESMSASLTVSTPTKNKLDKFQLKKNMALSNSPESNKAPIISTDPPASPESELEVEEKPERFFSVGGTLAIDKPGKVTPIIYTLSTDSFKNKKPDNDLPALRNYSYSTDSDESAFVYNATATTNDRDFTSGGNPLKTSSAFRSLFGNNDEDETLSINLSTIGDTSYNSDTDVGESTWDKDTILDTLSKSARSGASTFKSIFEDYADDENSTINLSTVGDSTVTTGADLDYSTLGQDVATLDTLGQESTLAYSSTYATAESGEGTMTTFGRNTVKSDDDTSVSRTERSTAVSSTERTSGSYSSSSAGHSSEDIHMRVDQIIVRSSESSKQSSSAFQSLVENKKNLIKNKASDAVAAAGREMHCEDSESDPGKIRSTASDLSDITTLSTAQRRVHSVPIMNYSNLFSTGGSTVWSSNANLKRDDQLFMSRAQTMLDFFEMRLNADKTELVLVPQDKHEFDKKFNVSTRLRFVESLRMRCVVKNEETQPTVKRCCRLGLDREGAENPIFATRALTDTTITLPVFEMETDADECKQNRSDDPTTDGTSSLSISQISLHPGQWQPALREGMKRSPKVLQPECSLNMCGMSFLVCVKDDHEYF